MKMKRLTLAALIVPFFAGSAPAAASQVAGGWYMGNWRCTLDGRATLMIWDVVSSDRGSAQGDVGTSVAVSERRGRFSDRGVVSALTLGRVTTTTVAFKRADGSDMFLRRRSATHALGHFIQNGRRHSLSCTKPG